MFGRGDKKAYGQKTAASLKRMRRSSTVPKEQLLQQRFGSKSSPKLGKSQKSKCVPRQTDLDFERAL